MSESYDPTEDGTEGGDAPGALSDTASSPLGVLPGQSAGVDSDSPLSALRAATAQLKAQRTGLSPMQKVSALLLGYAQPSAHTGWASGAVNAATNLQAQTLAQQKLDTTRQDLITKYDLASAHYQAQNQAANQRTAEMQAAQLAKAAKPALADNEARFRMGAARNYNPGVSDADLISRNLMYSPEVNAATLQWRAAPGMVAAGDMTLPAVPPLPSQGGGTSGAAPPTIANPKDGANYPNSPMVMTPGGLMHNPYYKGT